MRLACMVAEGKHYAMAQNMTKCAADSETHMKIQNKQQKCAANEKLLQEAKTNTLRVNTLLIQKW